MFDILLRMIIFVGCLEFQSKHGLEVAMEALRKGHRLKKCMVDALEDVTRICRVSNVKRPYMEMTVGND